MLKNFIILLVIIIIFYLVISNTNKLKTIENFRRRRKVNIGKTFKKIGRSIAKVAKKATNVVKGFVPMPKKSYVPKTYAKRSYGNGVGTIPLTFAMRPLKPGVKASRF